MQYQINIMYFIIYIHLLKVVNIFIVVLINFRAWKQDGKCQISRLESRHCDLTQ